MRVVLADIRSDRGFVVEDTAVGGYGQRLNGFNGMSRVAVRLRRWLSEHRNVTLAYARRCCKAEGTRSVVFTRDRVRNGDVALVPSSLGGHRREAAWADAARNRGLRVAVRAGFRPAAVHTVKTSIRLVLP